MGIIEERTEKGKREINNGLVMTLVTSYDVAANDGGFMTELRERNENVDKSMMHHVAYSPSIPFLRLFGFHFLHEDH